MQKIIKHQTLKRLVCKQRYGTRFPMFDVTRLQARTDKALKQSCLHNFEA